MSLRMYGIGSCDACRKARQWMKRQDVAFEWVDLRENPPPSQKISRWLSEAGADRLVNRRSTTWRNLPEDERPALDFDGWADFLLDHPTLIKRPVIDDGTSVCAGFSDDTRKWLAGT